MSEIQVYLHEWFLTARTAAASHRVARRTAELVFIQALRKVLNEMGVLLPFQKHLDDDAALYLLTSNARSTCIKISKNLNKFTEAASNKKFNP